MKITKSDFGRYHDETIEQFILENDNKMAVGIITLGATITSITVPEGDGKPVSLACGFNDLDGYLSEEYRSNAPYFGCTVGRYCSQIKDAAFILDGTKYELAANCGANNLHGGVTGFDKRVWGAEPFEREGEVGVRLSLSSPDMEEGFPGNVDVRVEISLSNGNEILISYEAAADRTTPLSLTNHTYFNLTGFKEDVTGHNASVYSNERLELDDSGAATGKVLNVADTVEDLRKGRRVGDVHDAIGGGFEHFYLFGEGSAELQKVAEMEDPVSGRKLVVESTEPCMLLYTGKYTSDELQRTVSEKYGKYRGFCCETHRYPNGPNIPGSPGSITHPGEKFSSRTLFRLFF